MTFWLVTIHSGFGGRFDSGFGGHFQTGFSGRFAPDYAPKEVGGMGVSKGGKLRGETAFAAAARRANIPRPGGLGVL